jgi:hypothetical protein
MQGLLPSCCCKCISDYPLLKWKWWLLWMGQVVFHCILGSGLMDHPPRGTRSSKHRVVDLGQALALLLQRETLGIAILHCCLSLLLPPTSWWMVPSVNYFSQVNIDRPPFSALPIWHKSGGATNHFKRPNCSIPLGSHWWFWCIRQSENLAELIF